MKFSNISTFAMSTLLVVGCAQMSPKPLNAAAPKVSGETVVLDKEENQLERAGAENHELVEASADDGTIKREVGALELDEELPDSEKDSIPYSNNFLLKKKTKRMQFWVEYFTKHQRERFQRFINNGEEYRHHIEKIFAEHGVPKELYYVGLIESGYYLGARSHAAAVGPWQFIKGTGKRYGLRITSELDERRDLFKASRAAAMYFKDLHNVFASWELALSAYNAGEYGILRRIMKHGTRDFYQLSKNKQLPTETINYVPKVLAAMHVIQNAKKYGFVIPRKSQKLFDLTELKTVHKNTSLRTLAKRLNISVDLLKKLNPELNHDKTPRYAGTYKLRVPAGKYSYKVETSKLVPGTKTVERPETRKELNRRIAKASEVKKVHKVKSGETLISIAKKYGTTPGALARLNNFSSWRTRVKIGQKLALSKNAPSRPSLKVVGRPLIYKVRQGDNLTDLARVFNSSVTQLKAANSLKRGKILVGQKIILPNTKKAVYTVKRGDHLTKVAKDFNLPLEAIIKLNALKRKTIYPGQKIIVNMD